MLIFNHFSRITILRLTVFFVVCLVVVSSIYWWVLPQISLQEKKAELLQFREIAPQIVIKDSVLDTAESIMIQGHPCIVYRVYRNNTVMAYFIKATTNKGYSGNIELLIGISADRQEILGVRVLKHHETPGLGDKIEKRISNWIDVFNHYPVLNNGLAVKKDGGEIDQFTGATITPRAVTNLVAVIAQRWREQGVQIE